MSDGKKKISYSAWKKYHDCPRLYKYHYIDRLRPSGTSSPLVFGTAVDEGLNAFLEDKKDPVAVFRDQFKFEDLQDVEWDGKDFDPDIFSAEQLDEIATQTWEYKCWASMRIKGRLLIESWVEQIYPKLDKVISVQKDIEGDNPGVMDIVAVVDGETTIIDNKTSGRLYKWDAVHTSSQLAFYASREGIDKAAFAVMVKTIGKDKKCQKCGNVATSSHKTCNAMVRGKRCHGPWSVTPKVQVQWLVDTVPERNKEIIEASISETEELIEAGHFPMNLGTCDFMYGKPCKYKNYCWKNDQTGLQYKKKKGE